MAAPLILWPLLSAFGTWLAHFIVKACDWVFNHWRMVKASAFYTIAIACFLAGLRAYTWVMGKLNLNVQSVREKITGSFSAVSANGDFLSILNYALPINETFALTAAYLSVFAGLISFKAFLSAYKNIPFKNT